jgi:hypothetical protein
MPNAAISHRGGVVGVARPSLQTLHWALNRRATARRGSSLMSVVWPQWCCLCDGSRVWHQIASAGVVRQSLGSASYHTLQSDMVCMECKIFRNIHSTSAAGVGQGLAIPGSYHDYRLGWIGWQICGDGAQAEGKGVAAANGPVRCRRHAGAFVERGTAAVSSPTSASLSNVQCPLSTVHCPLSTAPLRHCITALPRLLSWSRGGRLGEGGWAIIDRRRSQPQLCRSSSRLCRPCSHGQAQLLANKFSALTYAKPPLYH